jgi:glycine dehydrogenase
MISDKFINRHNGPSQEDIQIMLEKTGSGSLDELIRQTIPSSILMKKPLHLQEGICEYEYLKSIREIGLKNKLFRSFIGMGYYNTFTLPVIQRNILENPSWYTSYTPYQAEISQGRLTALLNFQSMVIDLTGMEVTNASLLDEGTAAAEAMIMMFNCRSREAAKEGRSRFFVDENIFPQTYAVMHTRALPLGIDLVKGDFAAFSFSGEFFGAFLQYPDSKGEVIDYRNFVEKAHSQEMLTGVAADLMSLVLLTPPGEWDADIVVGSTQRFGVPLGYGGPHAGFFACKDKFKRNMPGRIIGISVDRHGNPALRMALQTREQHIKREKATSNICTAQALLANMAGMYAVYHGPEGLTRIASNIHFAAKVIADKITGLGFKLVNKTYFDTLRILLPAGITSSDIQRTALEKKINFYYPDDKTVSLSVDETVNIEEINEIIDVFARVVKRKYELVKELKTEYQVPDELRRKSVFLTAEVFRKYRSETELMRYIKMLERKDFSLTHSMISLGSCTMKLNAASELMAFLWPEFSLIHPFVPIDQVEGYQQLFKELGNDLKEITGFDAVSFQPNSGAAGEYAGLMVIRAYHESRGDTQRNIVLIPASAHGTNPASAVMAGMEVVVVDCDEKGNVNIDSLQQLAEQHKDNLSGFMITYPSTHGVFEESVKKMIEIIHKNGGQVYMDGANMNAQVGLTNPAIIGADVCHLNLHKTFAIPHGGGGPGVGPIGVAAHLVEFLPSHPVLATGGVKGIQAISAAPYGSASILTISHAYIKMLGSEGLTMATKIAILNANYLAACLRDKFQILYTNENGRVAHEMILDCRSFKTSSGISETDIAKRLMDYGFHAPTLSFPVHGTLMIEPTESESKAELDRFIESMNSILDEINEVEDGISDKLDNVLKNAPHTAFEVTSDDWKHPYPRHKAAFPLKWIKENKFWPSVARLDDAFGDRNLVCSCTPVEAYKK